MPKGRGRAGGGMGKTLFSAIWLVVIAGAVLGWARANDITSLTEGYDYIKSWSDKADECVGEELGESRELQCGPNAPDNGPGGSDDGPGGGSGPGVPSDPEVVKLEETIKGVKIAPKVKVDYERGDWKHWSDLDKNGCDSREDVLLQQGKSVKTEAGDPCDAESGQWTSPYEGLKITDPSSIDIDHVIPLGYAATHGGQEWPAAKKEQFANDFTQLLATSASENRSKSDKGPGAYMPDKKEYWCSYSQIWVKTVKKYDLWVEESDRDALLEGLGTC